MSEGVDYAFNPPTVASLVAASKRFACRYGGPGSDSKQLHAAELRALTAGGIAVVANAEGTADGLASGWSVGEAWAKSSLAHFSALGMPDNRPVYLSVDFDCGPTRWPSVREALRGAASVLGASRVGVYGSYDVMNWALHDNVAKWFWQTYAWSGGRWAAHNHIEQYKNGVLMGGGNVDLNRSKQNDYGQWGVSTMGVWDEDVIPAPPDAADYATNKSWAAKNALGNVLAVVRTLADLDATGARKADVAAVLAQGKANAVALTTLTAALAELATALGNMAEELTTVNTMLENMGGGVTGQFNVNGTLTIAEGD